MQIKKAILLAFLVTSYSMQQQQNHFSIGLWLVMKSGFYMTTSNGQLSGWNEKEFQSTCQSQTCAQKRSWSLFGGLLPLRSTTAFLSQQNHYTWEVRSANQWDALKTAMPAAGIGQHSSPGDLPNPGIKPVSPAWQADSLPMSHLGHPLPISLPVWLEMGKVGSLHFFPSLDLFFKLPLTPQGIWRSERQKKA